MAFRGKWHSHAAVQYSNYKFVALWVLDLKIMGDFLLAYDI
jgi:hypothetical protein